MENEWAMTITWHGVTIQILWGLFIGLITGIWPRRSWPIFLGACVPQPIFMIALKSLDQIAFFLALAVAFCIGWFWLRKRTADYKKIQELKELAGAVLEHLRLDHDSDYKLPKDQGFKITKVKLGHRLHEVHLKSVDGEAKTLQLELWESCGHDFDWRCDVRENGVGVGGRPIYYKKNV